MWGGTDFNAFAEESFDPGDVLIINGSRLTLSGFGVVQENKKLRLAWIVRVKSDALPDPTEKQSSFKNVMMLQSSPPVHLCLVYAERMNDCPRLHK